MNVQTEIRNIWLYLGNLMIGPTWRLYIHSANSVNDGLYLQYKKPDTGKWTSLVRVTKAGVITSTGTVTGSATLVDVGNG